MIDLNNKIYREKIAQAYFFVKDVIIKNGYAPEVDWQHNISFNDITSSVFIKETSWVILASGMSDYVVSRKFNDLSNVFFDWNIELIMLNKDICKSNALKIFNHVKKINSIIEAANILNDLGLKEIKRMLLVDGVDYLERFPFIGPITKFHLAKNIGLEFSKPDRHLKRISDFLGCDSPASLCHNIADYIEEKVSVVDIVIWRYATLDKDYIKKLNIYLKKYNS